MSVEDVALHLQDEEDWLEVITRFLSSPEMSRVRADARTHFENPNFQLSAHYYKIDDMAKLDMRYVVQTPTGKEYVTPFIKRIYIEELRGLEQRTCFKGGGWAPYCRYILENNFAVNWSKMGWLCEELVGDVVFYKGLVLGGMAITGVWTQKFFHIPRYSLWQNELMDGANKRGILFIPATKNYPLINGVIVWRDSSGHLHFYALQITVNHERHQARSASFMAKQIIKEWIPDNLEDWILHFVFICLKDKEAVLVPQNLKTLMGGIEYGNVQYHLHTVSFMKAMEEYVKKDLIDMVATIASRRDNAGWKGRSPVSTSGAAEAVTMINKPAVKD